MRLLRRRFAAPRNDIHYFTTPESTQRSVSLFVPSFQQKYIRAPSERLHPLRFAFLMSVPVMLAAGGYEMLDVIQMPNLSEFLPLLAVGFIAAAIVGWMAIKWLIDYLSNHSLYVFAAYCVIVGIICFINYLI